MARRRAAEKRDILPDPKYKNVVLTKFMNSLMWEGKKSIAETIVYKALDRVRDPHKLADELKFFLDALENVKPKLEVKSRRVGGATYQVPVPVSMERSQALAIRWLIYAARQRGEKTMEERLANELSDANNSRGGAVKKKEDTLRMAQANKAFAHYRW